MIASKRNATKIPDLDDFGEFHIYLPTKEFRLTKPNFHVYDEKIHMNLEKEIARRRTNLDPYNEPVPQEYAYELQKIYENYATGQEMSEIGSSEVRLENLSCQSLTEKQEHNKKVYFDEYFENFK